MEDEKEKRASMTFRAKKGITRRGVSAPIAEKVGKGNHTFSKKEYGFQSEKDNTVEIIYMPRGKKPKNIIQSPRQGKKKGVPICGKKLKPLRTEEAIATFSQEEGKRVKGRS